MINRSPGSRNNLVEVAGEISDRWIDLGQRDLHISSLMQRPSAACKAANICEAGDQVPVPERTTPTVRMMIFRSRKMLQFSMYVMSSET